MKTLTPKTLLLLTLLISSIYQSPVEAQLRNGLYGGTAPGGPIPNVESQYGFIYKQNRKLKNLIFLTYTRCRYSSGRIIEHLAHETNDSYGALRIRMQGDNTFRKAFSWEASDGTLKKTILRGRPDGKNKLRVRAKATARYVDDDPDVDLTCEGAAIYRMRYMPSSEAKSYVGFSGSNSAGFDLTGRTISGLTITVQGECSLQEGGSYARTFIVRAIDIPDFIFTGSTTINQEIAAEAGAFNLDAQFTRTSPQSITIDITVSSQNGGTTCLGNATIVAETSS
jgi:hypothetical protein